MFQIFHYFRLILDLTSCKQPAFCVSGTVYFSRKLQVRLTRVARDLRRADDCEAVGRVGWLGKTETCQDLTEIADGFFKYLESPSDPLQMGP